MNGRYQVGSGRVVTVTHDTPFIEDIIPQDSEIVNKKFSTDDSDGEIADVGENEGVVDADERSARTKKAENLTFSAFEF